VFNAVLDGPEVSIESYLLGPVTSPEIEKFAYIRVGLSKTVILLLKIAIFIFFISKLEHQ